MPVDEAILRRQQNLKRIRAREPEITEVLNALAGLCVPVLFDYQCYPAGAHAGDELARDRRAGGSGALFRGSGRSDDGGPRQGFVKPDGNARRVAGR
jgi:hypothetical protein